MPADSIPLAITCTLAGRRDKLSVHDQTWSGVVSNVVSRDMHLDAMTEYHVLRETELTETYPTHVVCAWLGNSPAVAHNHYPQVRDQHFADAVGEISNTGALQVALQQGAERGGTEPQPHLANFAQVASLQSNTAPCETVPFAEVTPMGFEPMLPP